MSCCELHPFVPVLTKQKGPRGWDGRKPLYFTDEHWGVSVKGRLVCEGMWADRVSADNYAWLLGHEIHGTDPRVLSGEVVVDG